MAEAQTTPKDDVLKCHQLLIIGNGFDLACGLKSRFEDFFAPRLATIQSIRDYDEASWCRTINEAGLTIWDFLLEGNSEEDWCDIEKAISTWIVPVIDVVTTPLPMRRLLHKVKEYPFAVVGSVLFGNRLQGEQSDEDYATGNAVRYIWAALGSEKARDITEDDLYELLAAELTRLEAAFDRYLRNQIKGNTAYYERARDLYRRMHDTGYDEWMLPHVKTSILTFNYTNPFADSLSEMGGDVVNIHGNLGGGIIFGIDGQDCLDNEHALPFTKTYRVAVAGNQVTSDLFYENQRATDDPDAHVIKFYGHSLGEADYSYFQSFFDGFNLYGGNTKLVFFYSPWESGGKKLSSEQARTDMVKSVAKLLNIYGKTLDNRDHGKNLMHKLLLEGRLVVEEIKGRELKPRADFNCCPG